MSLKLQINNIYVGFRRNIWNSIPIFTVFFGLIFQFSPYFLDFKEKDRIFASGNLHI